MVTFALRWLGVFLAVLLAGALWPALVNYTGWQAVAVFGLILALLNAFVRPILAVLTLPLTCLTLGLFHVVLNALLFWVAAAVYPSGVQVAGVLGAVAGAIVVSIVSTVLSWIAR